jgi:hypothetical protein
VTSPTAESLAAVSNTNTKSLMVANYLNVFVSFVFCSQLEQELAGSLEIAPNANNNHNQPSDSQQQTTSAVEDWPDLELGDSSSSPSNTTVTTAAVTTNKTSSKNKAAIPR